MEGWTDWMDERQIVKILQRHRDTMYEGLMMEP
jgi:hypothetical protein